MISPGLKLDLHYWRFAGDDKGLELAISMANAIPQHQANGVGSVLHIIGSQEACLPYILAGKISELLHQAKGKQCGDGANRFIRLNSQHRIAGTDDAQAATMREERLEMTYRA